MSSLSADVVQEAALYLEYFLKGLCECNVVGSYTVQFLEQRSCGFRLEASLASHLLCLLSNMKGLLMKLDSTLLPYNSIGVQTEEDPLLCSLCGSRCPFGSSPKRSPLPKLKESYEGLSLEKRCEDSPKISHLFTPASLVPMKQELLVATDVSPVDEDPGNRMDETDVLRGGSSGTKDPLSLDNQSTSAQIKEEKCSMALSFPDPLEDGVNIAYTNEHIEDEQGEILLDHLDESDGGHSDGLMYSIYTMNSCGSLQLVSRVLSKSNSLKDSVNEPVEKAMIEINNLKVEFNPQDNLEGETMEEDGSENQDSGGAQNLSDNSDSNVCQGPKVSHKIERSKLKQLRLVEEASSRDPLLLEIVKLGPEDVGNGTWCDECGKEFPSVGSLKAHVLQTHRKAKKCNTCSKVITSGDMTSHIKECHSELPFVCTVCGQSLRTNGALQRHMDIHKGLRGSACEVCGQTFSRTEYYRDHIRVHTGEKPFKCKICKKTFSRSSNLYTHMRIHNSEEQWHTCKLCMKSFSRADKLKEHMIRHSQVKRYSCRLCTKSYREKRDLVKHLGKVHASESSIYPD